MALQPNPFGFMSERATNRLTRRARSVQRYWQPLLVPDSPSDLIQDAPTDPAIEQLTTLTIENLSASHAQGSWSLVVAGLDSLMAPGEENEGSRPTEYAYRAARSVVESAYGRLLSERKTSMFNIPLPIVITDDRGGVKLAWHQGTKHVRVNFGAAPELRAYLYFESSAEHDIEALQPSNLSKRLNWLLTP
jgi:hypothetical protein